MIDLTEILHVIVTLELGPDRSGATATADRDTPTASAPPG
jgi:hypothetical protein